MIRRVEIRHSDRIEYGQRLSEDAALLGDAPAEPGVARLRTYTIAAGEAVLLGRYHVLPDPHPSCEVCVLRRRTGGRVVPFGNGFLGVSLILPHRSALVADDAHALNPGQVLNRCVRGILRGLADNGAPAFYPGRDLLTVDRRRLGIVSFETTSTGALLFEAVLALDRDFAVLPRRLDAADPSGVVRAELLEPEQAITLSEVLERPVAAAEVGEWIARGYQTAFGIEGSIAPDGFSPSGRLEEGMLPERRLVPQLDRHGAVTIQIGTLEAHYALNERAFSAAILAGDFIANSLAVEEFETSLVGASFDRGTIIARAIAAFERPEAFLLGPSSLAQVADAFG